MILEQVTGSLLGLAVGDALGVPVEFLPRTLLKQNPVLNMRAYGTHQQPQGTWSDDSSLTFCLAESLLCGYDLQDLATRFVNWYNHNYWTPHGIVFDVGVATSSAIHDLSRGITPINAGGKTENSNGNGSLMRILPLLWHIKDLPIEVRFQKTKEVSSLTHAHIRSVIGGFYYLEYARNLVLGMDIFAAFDQTKASLNPFFKTQKVPQSEIDIYHRLLVNPIGNYNIKPIFEYQESEIRSSGYVVHTLEASLWCLMTSQSYSETVLKAVNLGEDTDTTAAVTGGLAGLYYGLEAIPKDWIAVLVKKDAIISLANRLKTALQSL